MNEAHAHSDIEPIAGKGCSAMTSFMVGAASYKYSIYKNMAQASSAISAGFAAVAADELLDYVNVTCTEGVVDYIERAQEMELSYDDYIENYCDGDAFRCTDPLLDVGCYSSGCAFPPSSCEHFIMCAGSIAGLGSTGVNVNSFIDAMHYPNADG